MHLRVHDKTADDALISAGSTALNPVLSGALKILVRTALCLSIGTVLFTGCGKSSGLQKSEVSGKVTYNGEPIRDGDISFQPDQGTAGPPSSGTIKNGVYRLDGEWGLAAGTYKVKINAYRPAAPGGSNMLPGGLLDKPPETPGVPARDQYLPEKFNTNTTIEKLVVAAGQKIIEKNYDLK